MSSQRKVVVTGLGMATALGLGVEASWRKALAGETGIRRLRYPQAARSPVQAVGMVAVEDLKRIRAEFPVESQQAGEKRSLFALWSAMSAVEDAGLTKDKQRGDRCGVTMAAGLGINRLEDIQRWTDQHKIFDQQRFGRECAQAHPESIIKNNAHYPAALIAGKLGWSGASLAITTACASATQAIGIAYQQVCRGEADIMLSGGADSMLNPIGLVFFVLLGAAATGSENPTQACKPFDRKRSGLVMGEGAGIVILEEEMHAVRRGAKIYAEVAGYGTSLDAYQVTAPHPKGVGAAKCMQRALADAGLMPSDIDYINAHGTGTKLNDAAESVAIKTVFKENAYGLAINSSKALIGHLLAASGGPEFVFTVLSVQRDLLHPTLNLTRPDPKCDLNYLAQGKEARLVRAAISNSFGFGGQNASIVIKKYKPELSGSRFRVQRFEG